MAYFILRQFKLLILVAEASGDSMESSSPVKDEKDEPACMEGVCSKFDQLVMHVKFLFYVDI